MAFAVVTAAAVVTSASIAFTVAPSPATLGFFRLLGILFVEHSDHDGGRTTSLLDLEEGVVVVLAIFALSAEIEVFADRALVAYAKDRVHFAAVTRDALVDSRPGDLSFDLGVGFLSSKSVFFHNLVENDARLLIELVLDEALEGLPRHAALATLVSLLALLGFRLLELDLLLNHGDGVTLLFNQEALRDFDGGLFESGGFDALLFHDDVELDFLGGAECEGVGHVEVAVVFHVNGFVVGVQVLDLEVARLAGLADHETDSVVELLERRNGRDALDSNVVTGGEAELDI